jgi:hypothetical protein
MAIATFINFCVTKTALNGKLSCTIATFDMMSNRKESNQGYDLEAQGTHDGQFNIDVFSRRSRQTQTSSS